MAQANTDVSAEMGSVSPFFIGRDAKLALAFYRVRLGST